MDGVVEFIIVFSVFGEVILWMYCSLCISIIMAFASKLLKIINDNRIIVIIVHVMYLILQLKSKNIHGTYVLLELYPHG